MSCSAKCKVAAEVPVVVFKNATLDPVRFRLIYIKNVNVERNYVLWSSLPLLPFVDSFQWQDRSNKAHLLNF